MAGRALWLYRGLMGLLAPIGIPVLSLRDRLTGKRRPPWSERLVRRAPEVKPGGMWIQAVSVGEVEVARRLVAGLRAADPRLVITVTATTATGLDLARRSFPSDVVVAACPLDLMGPVRRFLDALQPCLVVLVETELWPEMLAQCGERGLQVAVVNARLSGRSFGGYRRIGVLLDELLRPVTRVLARDSEDAARFMGLGVPSARVQAVGNIKYDLDADPRPLPWAEALRTAAADRPVIVAGSTMEGEEERLLSVLGRLDPQPLVILAPRHPERFDAVANLTASWGFRVCRRSTVGDGPLDPDTQVFLLDTIGELARSYRLARLAFIGGSLVPTGGHNPLEPLVWGVPVLTGPHVHNFTEVYRVLFACGSAKIVADDSALEKAVSLWLEDPDAAAAAGGAGLAAVQASRGATARTVAVLLGLLEAGR